MEEPAAEEPAAEEPAAVDGKLRWVCGPLGGQSERMGVIEQWVADFNAQSEQFEVVIESFPRILQRPVAAASCGREPAASSTWMGYRVQQLCLVGLRSALPITEAELGRDGHPDNDIAATMARFTGGPVRCCLACLCTQVHPDQYGTAYQQLGNRDT